LTEAWEHKVDHRLRALLAQRPGSADRVAVFVRVAGDTARLASLGLAAGNRAGDVMTASLALTDVADVAAAPEVVFVELSRPLTFDA
jgi:hypothetical protein